jgi:tRNA-intron endonuclease
MSKNKTGAALKRAGKATAKKPAGTLLETRIIIRSGYDELLQRGFGKHIERSLELALVEALYLVEKNKVSIKQGRKPIKFAALLDYGVGKDPRLHEKFIVYRDLRDRGFLVKTGFKFGCDFRVYQRGVALKRGPKTPEEHTKWVVYTVPEDYTCSFQELSRAVRLAHSIRAKMLWAVVDNESNVTYYTIMRSTL